MKKGVKFFASAIVLGFFVFVNFANAVMLVPTANITIVKNTVGEEGVFNFELKQLFGVVSEPYDEFDLQTIDGTASYGTFLIAFSGAEFLLKEQQQEGWDLSGVICISDEPYSQFIPSEHGVKIVPSVNANIVCTFTNSKEQEQLQPVIIVPGIMGSAEKDGHLVIDPILHTYDDLIKTLVANGYEEGVDLFRFPYDWRQSNVVTALYLEDKINEIKQICACDKVDIVAHSMGGLVARQYIQSGHYENDVDQLIFLGTPHLGSAKSYLTWEAGELPPGTVNFFMENLFSAEARKSGYKSLFEYVRNRPIYSVQELLPIFDYLKEKDSGNIRAYPESYPKNLFLEILDQTSSYLESSGVNISNIIGDFGQITINTIRVGEPNFVDSGKWEHGKPDGFYNFFGDKGLERGSGDGTVNFISGTGNNYFNSEIISAEHDSLPTAAEGRIFEILTGKEPTVTYDSGFYVSPKILFFQLFSPVDMFIEAPDGKKIGKNFETGEKYNEIEYAFYSGFGTDNEYITILNPLDGEYKIFTQGTDEGGEYTVQGNYITDEESVSSEFSSYTTPGKISELNLDLESAQPESFEIIQTGPITPESTLTDIENAYELGWIYKEKAKKQLIKKLKKIIRKEERIEYLKDSNKKNKLRRIIRIEKTVDKILGKTLLKELERDYYRKGVINEQAYNLIKGDIEWMLNN